MYKNSGNVYSWKCPSRSDRRPAFGATEATQGLPLGRDRSEGDRWTIPLIDVNK